LERQTRVRVDAPVEPPSDPAPVVEPMPTAPAVRPMIEVELPSGIKLRVTGMVEGAALRRVLSALS
jgi:transposase